MKYIIKYAENVEFAGNSIISARKKAIEVIEKSNGYICVVGIFDERNMIIGKVSKTNSFPYLWEVPVKGMYGTYRIENLLNRNGTLSNNLYNRGFKNGFYW